MMIKGFMKHKYKWVVLLQLMWGLLEPVANKSELAKIAKCWVSQIKSACACPCSDKGVISWAPDSHRWTRHPKHFRYDLPGSPGGTAIPFHPCHTQQTRWHNYRLCWSAIFQRRFFVTVPDGGQGYDRRSLVPAVKDTYVSDTSNYENSWCDSWVHDQCSSQLSLSSSASESQLSSSESKMHCYLRSDQIQNMFKLWNFRKARIILTH